MTARQWRMGILLGAGTAIFSAILLTMTGIPLFTWTTGLGFVALVICAIGAWRGGPATGTARPGREAP